MKTSGRIRRKLIVMMFFLLGVGKNESVVVTAGMGFVQRPGVPHLTGKEERFLSFGLHFTIHSLVFLFSVHLWTDPSRTI